MTDQRECAHCGFTFPLAAFPTNRAGLGYVCRDCHPKRPVILRVAGIAATHILRCRGASALLGLGYTGPAKDVLAGYWPSLRQLRGLPEQRRG